MQIEKRAHFGRRTGCDARLELVQLFAHDVEGRGQPSDFMQHIAPLDRVLTNVELRPREQMRATHGDAVRHTTAGQRAAAALRSIDPFSHAPRRSPM